MFGRPKQAVFQAAHPSVTRINLFAELGPKVDAIRTRWEIFGHSLYVLRQRTVTASWSRKSAGQYIERRNIRGVAVAVVFKLGDAVLTGALDEGRGAIFLDQALGVAALGAW